MDMGKIVETLETALQNGTLVLYALMAFAVIVFIGWLVIFTLQRAINKKTEMNGLISVGVALNDWLDTPPENAPPRLAYGTVMLHMHDPASVQKGRLDPVLNWREKAYCRKYEVVRLLERHCNALEKSGLQGDDGVALLREMLEGNHYIGLGSICIPGAKKGLVIQGTAENKQDKKNNYRLMVYVEIPESLAKKYADSTQSAAKNLCITLEYYSQS